MSGEREKVAAEFEACRAAGLRIADAASRFAVRTEDLEWALWATDKPKSEKFNHAYAAKALAERTLEWREARNTLREALEQERFP